MYPCLSVQTKAFVLIWSLQPEWFRCFVARLTRLESALLTLLFLFLNLAAERGRATRCPALSRDTLLFPDPRLGGRRGDGDGLHLYIRTGGSAGDWDWTGAAPKRALIVLPLCPSARHWSTIPLMLIKCQPDLWPPSAERDRSADLRWISQYKTLWMACVQRARSFRSAFHRNSSMRDIRVTIYMW